MEWIGVLIALGIPALVNWVAKSKIPISSKYVIAIVASLATGVATTFLSGGLKDFTWPKLGEYIAVVVAAQHAAWELGWKKVFNKDDPIPDTLPPWLNKNPGDSTTI